MRKVFHNSRIAPLKALPWPCFQSVWIQIVLEFCNAPHCEPGVIFSLRCGGKWLQMWNWGILALGWGEAAETRPLLLLSHLTIQQLHIDTHFEWGSLSQAGTSQRNDRQYRGGSHNRPTAGPVYVLVSSASRVTWCFWDNRSHRATCSYLRSLCVVSAKWLNVLQIIRGQRVHDLIRLHFVESEVLLF